MTDEAKALVERLRAVDVSWSETGELCAWSADLIETQAREIDRLTLVGQALRMQRDAARAALGESHD